MGNHRRAATSHVRARKWTSYATTAVALEVVSLVGLTHLTNVQTSPISLLTTTIFVDGTEEILPSGEPYDPFRLKDTLNGAYAQQGYDILYTDGTTLPAGDGNVFIDYPRTAGVFTGLGSPTYDESEAEGTRLLLDAIRQAQANGEDEIIVVGYSQGAGAAAQALGRLTDADAATVDQVVLIADPRRNDGGILTRLPDGLYVPLIGATGGEGTSNPTGRDGILVIQVTKQYDGIADAPKYPANVLADVNAAMGYYYLHRDMYQNVDLDLNGDEVVDQKDITMAETMPDKYLVTHSDDGVTDVLVLTPTGQLPLTRPLLDLGVPEQLVAALDPVLRPVIEAGYDRPQPGEPYPDEPVPAQPLPAPATGQPATTDSSVSSLVAATQPVHTRSNDGVPPTGAPDPQVVGASKTEATVDQATPETALSPPRHTRLSDLFTEKPSPRAVRGDEESGDTVRWTFGRRDRSTTTERHSGRPADSVSGSATPGAATESSTDTSGADSTSDTPSQ